MAAVVKCEMCSPQKEKCGVKNTFTIEMFKKDLDKMRRNTTLKHEHIFKTSKFNVYLKRLLQHTPDKGFATRQQSGICPQTSHCGQGTGPGL